MTSLLIAFFISLMVSIIIIRTQKLHGRFSGDVDFNGPQKFHKNIVPRIGGLAIGVAIFISIILHYKNNLENIDEIFMLLSALPAFGVGIAEDLTKNISVKTRLFLTAIGAAIFVLLMKAHITSLGIPYADFVIAIPLVSMAFTIFAITGLANAYNLIDGFNGLSSMIGAIALMAISYLGFQFNDSLIIFLCFTMVGAILGFFIWNYPRGLIFLGDGGAYLIGFWVAAVSVLVITRHNAISPWFPLAVNAYPIIETLFTIYRRKFLQRRNLGHPDGIHFHSLIFRRITHPSHIHTEIKWISANARTSPYLWILSSLTVIPAILFWHSSLILIGCLVAYTFIYVLLYKKLASFKTPNWMKF